MYQLLLIIIYVSFISLGLPDSLLGSAWPSMYGGLSVPISYAGIIAMIISGCTILSSLFSDRLVRRFQTGKVTVISVGMTALALFGFSISNHFILLCLWAIPYGLGAGSVDAALNNFVALHYKAKHMNWLHCFWGVGASLGPYIMGACLTGNLGWNMGYRSISVIQIILTLLLLLSLPLWKRTKKEAEEEHAQAPAPRALDLWKLAGAKQILTAFLCYCALEQAAGLWGSSYMVIKKGISPQMAASFISLFYLGITGGRFLSGVLSMKMSSRQMIRLGQGLALAGAVVLFFASGNAVICAGFILIGLGCAPIYPCLLHQTPERFGAETSQAMMGLQMACAYVGSTCAPPIVGVVTEKLGMGLYPLFLLFFVVLMVLTVETGDRKRRLSSEK